MSGHKSDNTTIVMGDDNFFEDVLEEKYAELEKCGVLYFELDMLEEFNKEYGQESESVLEEIAGHINELQCESVDVYRIKKNSFIAIGKDFSKEQIRNLAQGWITNWKKLADRKNYADIMSVGVSWDSAPVSAKSLMIKAKEEMLYNRKLMSEGVPLDYCVHGEISSSFGLLTRKQFFKNVDYKLKNTEEKYCITAIDIEHFKLFNKWHGRSAGDELLAAFAKILREFEKTYDGIATYFGGDDFAILLPDDRDIIVSLANKLVNEVMGKVKTAGFLPAFGVYSIENKDMDTLDMYDYAVEALTQIIGRYEKRICYYDKDMTSEMEKEIDTIVAAREALKNNEFTIFLQPQVRINSGKVIGAEALVRWISPDRGMVSPGEFIPVLEKNGFIGEVDQYVWELTCKTIRSWTDKGITPVPVSVNVSRIDILSFDTVRYLNELVEKYQIDKKYLKIEITESAYVDNGDKILDTIKNLRESGYILMMDDFGSGYSSLNMLREAIVDIIKLDMRFLDMDNGDVQKGISILKSVIDMTNEIGTPIVIEGVETKQQEDFLQDMGVRFAQGYLYYKPMPYDKFEHLISKEENVDRRGIYNKDIDVKNLDKAIEKMLRERNKRYQQIGITKTRGGFFEYESTGSQKLHGVSQSVAYMFGCDTVEEFREYVGDSFLGMVHPDDRERVLYEINSQISGSELKMDYIEYRILRKDGSVRYVYDYGHLEEKRDDVSCFYVFLLDVTERIKE